MLIEHARDSNGVFLYDSEGSPVRKYHFGEPRLEKECIRRMDERGMSPADAFSSMCTCAKHICEAHGVRNDPYPFTKLPVEMLGCGMYIHQYKDSSGNWITDLVFSRLDQVVEAKRRMEFGMSANQAYHSMCQCDQQVCPAHGARRYYNAKSLQDYPHLRILMDELEARRFKQ